jgi:hypothetical protein
MQKVAVWANPPMHIPFSRHTKFRSALSMNLLVVSLVSFLLATALRSISTADPFKQALSSWLAYFLGVPFLRNYLY